MHSFSHIATKLLKESKQLIRKHFSTEESEQKLIALSLNGRLPRQEANLYRLLTTVLEKMSQDYKKISGSVRYSGAGRFLSHAKKTMKEYCLDGKKVIHIKQTVSREAVKAAQLVALHETQLTVNVFSALDQKAMLIASHGEVEQKHFFKRLLHAHLPRHPEFFKPLVENYGRYLGGAQLELMMD